MSKIRQEVKDYALNRVKDLRTKANGNPLSELEYFLAGFNDGLLEAQDKLDALNLCIFEEKND